MILDKVSSIAVVNSKALFSGRPFIIENSFINWSTGFRFFKSDSILILLTINPSLKFMIYNLEKNIC